MVAEERSEFNGVIHRKLALLDAQLSRLEQALKKISFSQFRKDWILTSMAERALQVSVEIVIDVAERIVAIKKYGPVGSAAEAIDKLVELECLKSSSPYLDMIRFRNFLVHEYERIDPHFTFQIAKEHLKDFRRFRDEIDRYVSK
ncbi:MAG TPA: DUF86 domain-containing protein [Verrucomicrobiales bacterium]|nr:DUF86 domain-containing protein [Verrucomicrobiales bacterium]HIL69229.1 DUF86 domain-containing protein [Verrucomicrobiota bacterium]